MTPAEKRIKELIDRWLASIELHLQYVNLSDEAYREIQDWPKHDRPTRWVLELAKQKASDLKYAFEGRQQMGDSRFADALELMSFLANLVGAQHVDRFIPMAEPQAETAVPKPTPKAVSVAPASSDVPKWYAQAHAAAPAQPPPVKVAAVRSEPAVEPIKTPPRSAAPASPPVRPPSQVVPQSKPSLRTLDPEATREMPKPPIQQRPTASAPAPKPEPKKSAAPPKSSAKTASTPTNEIEFTVIADAIRLLGWGRTWHELAELIARMADRPPIADVRKVLRAHRAAIEKAAKDAAK